MKHNWENVIHEDVLKAIKKFEKENPDYPEPRNTYLVFNGEKYPAKHIRGIAYYIANGVQIKKSEFSGGEETARFFKKLRFEIEYKNMKLPLETSGIINKKPANMSVVHQKNALQKLLQKKFGIIETEKKFGWLKTPSKENLPHEYTDIYNGLRNHRNHSDFFKANFKLSCDFYFEDVNLIIEYDERQHFSLARKIALENYPKGITLGFSLRDWIIACESINAKDNDPPDRDEKRAFYDSVRDIEAFKHGYTLIRVKHGDYNWESEDAWKYIDTIFALDKKGGIQHKIASLINSRESSELLETFDWRSLELEFQRVRLNYIKWLFYFTPPVEEIYSGSGTGGSYEIFNSYFGRSFSLFPCGIGCVYAGGGKGCVGLPPECFKKNKDLEEETESIINTLPEFIRELRVNIKEQLELYNISLVWEMIQNYYWIKFGMHEYIFDISFDPNTADAEITEDTIRDYVIKSMYHKIDLSKKTPNKFSAQDIYKLLSNKFTWNRYAICSYDSGPLGWGKDGYVPFSVISKTIREYYRVYSCLLDDIYSNEEITSPEEEDNAVKDFAADSLKNLYDFKILYHKTPIADSNYYKDFLKHKQEIRELIIDTQGSINKVIEEEHLLLEKHHFIPK
ncbi:MAG TPA: hypothetical protein ENH82_20575 [bacterium]|nr:hypothetical protein [bacterium]